MKNTLLGLAIVATLTIVSCKQETKDKVGEAKDAIGAEMDQAVDTAAVKMDAAIDSTKSKISTKMKEGAAKMNQKADEMKEEVKK
jgi:F0F1-type ATP synthase membrane subunit b/b'